MNIDEVFDKYNDEFLKFDRIENPPYRRPDLCAFLLLEKLFPDDSDIVAGASHDEIYLGVDPYEFAKVANEQDVIYLLRCGVRFDGSTDSLAMFT